MTGGVIKIPGLKFEVQAVAETGVGFGVQGAEAWYKYAKSMKITGNRNGREVRSSCHIFQNVYILSFEAKYISFYGEYTHFTNLRCGGHTL